MHRAWVIGAAASSAFLHVTPAQAEIRIGLAAGLSGDVSWIGEQQEIGARRAVADINAAGGLLGEQVTLVTLDDGCDGELAAAVARQMVEEQVVFVNGHTCSGASLAAAPIYAGAGILMISSSSTNPKLTDSGWPEVFRVTGRDDDQGRIAGDYIADHWPEAKVAILHHGLAYGVGLAEETARQLRARGIEPVIEDGFEAGEVDFTDLIDRLEAAAVDVIYSGSYHAEAAMILKQATQRGLKVQLMGADALAGEDFLIYTGDDGIGTLFTFGPDPIDFPEAANVVRSFRDEEGFEPAGFTLHSYATVQVWAEAVRHAQSTEPAAVAEALRAGSYDSVLGTLTFDEKGDVSSGVEYRMFVWDENSFRLAD